MSDVIGIAYVILLSGASGFFVGRNTAKPAETWQHRLGEQLAQAANGWRQTKSVVGEPMLVTRLCTLTGSGLPDVELRLKEPV